MLYCAKHVSFSISTRRQWPSEVNRERFKEMCYPQVHCRYIRTSSQANKIVHCSNSMHVQFAATKGLKVMHKTLLTFSTFGTVFVDFSVLNKMFYSGLSWVLEKSGSTGPYKADWKRMLPKILKSTILFLNK